MRFFCNDTKSGESNNLVVGIVPPAIVSFSQLSNRTFTLQCASPGSNGKPGVTFAPEDTVTIPFATPTSRICNRALDHASVAGQAAKHPVKRW